MYRLYPHNGSVVGRGEWRLILGTVSPADYGEAATGRDGDEAEAAGGGGEEETGGPALVSFVCGTVGRCLTN